MFLAGSTNSYGEGGILGAAAGGVGRRRGRGAAVSGGAARARQWQAPLASGTSQCALRRKAGFAAGSAKIRLPEAGGADVPAPGRVPAAHGGGVGLVFNVSKKWGAVQIGAGAGISYGVTATS